MSYEPTITDINWSDRWQATHPPVDSDDRSPVEVLNDELISYREFLLLVAPGALAAQEQFRSMFPAGYTPQTIITQQLSRL